ncbi:hypothetical protein ACOSOMT5_P1311 [Acidiphilium sp. MT5]
MNGGGCEREKFGVTNRLWWARVVTGAVDLYDGVGGRIWVCRDNLNRDPFRLRDCGDAGSDFIGAQQTRIRPQFLVIDGRYDCPHGTAIVGGEKT